MNKIFGLGGDYISVEIVNGHLRAARENISKMLSNRVNAGRISPGYVKSIIYKLFYQNPAELFEI